jgi:hypothetical protein
MIPGPLVPFFQALSVCNSGHPTLGDVTPVLPDLTACTPGNHFNTNIYGVPNVLSLCDILARLSNATTAPPDNYDPVEHTAHSFFGVPVPATNNGHMRVIASTPGYLHGSRLVYHDLLRFHQARRRINMPPSLDSVNVTSTGPATWPQFLRHSRFAGEPHSPFFRTWFASVATVMSEYSAYFSDCISLGDIPVASGAAPLTMSDYSPPSAAVPRPGALAAHNAAPIPHYVLV